MKMAATLLHNVSEDMFLGFKPDTSRLHHAHTFGIEADDIWSAANLVYEITNVDPEDLRGGKEVYAEQAVEYRTRKNRSTSVGDVLVLSRPAPSGVGALLRPSIHSIEDEQILAVFACAPVGWEPLEFLPDFTPGANLTETSTAHVAHENLYANPPSREQVLRKLRQVFE